MSISLYHQKRANYLKINKLQRLLGYYDGWGSLGLS